MRDTSLSGYRCPYCGKRKRKAAAGSLGFICIARLMEVHRRQDHDSTSEECGCNKPPKTKSSGTAVLRTLGALGQFVGGISAAALVILRLFGYI